MDNRSINSDGTSNQIVSPVELAINDVSITFGSHRVLDRISFSASTPGLIHLTGQNGSGKSTLVELISGYLQSDSGTISVNGADVRRSDARHLRRVCRAKPGLFGPMSAKDHLALAARTSHVSIDEALHRFTELGGEAWLAHSADSLSTGNTRKLWIVMCTLGDPAVIVLDEPFDGLDESGITRLSESIRAWSQTRIVILVAHTPPENLVCTTTWDLSLPSTE